MYVCLYILLPCMGCLNITIIFKNIWENLPKKSKELVMGGFDILWVISFNGEKVTQKKTNA